MQDAAHTNLSSSKTVSYGTVVVLALIATFSVPGLAFGDAYGARNGAWLVDHGTRTAKLVESALPGTAEKRSENLLSAGASKRSRTQAAWSQRPEIGLVDLPLGTGTGTLIAEDVVLTSARLVPSRPLKGGLSDAHFIVYMGSAQRAYSFKVVGYEQVGDDVTSRTGLALLKLATSVTKRLPDVRPAVLAQEAPRSGVQVDRFGFGGVACVAQYGGGTKLSVRYRLDSEWNFLNGTGVTQCPNNLGSPLIEVKTGHVFAISNNVGHEVVGGMRRQDLANPISSRMLIHQKARSLHLEKRVASKHGSQRLHGLRLSVK